MDKTLDAETTCFEEDYVLPDGTKITIGKERFEAPEILFTPWIGNLECCGLGELVFESIRGADTTLRPKLYKNILLCGGTTFLPGFRDRLLLEMKKSYKEFVNKNPKKDLDLLIDVVAPPRRNINVFMGGALYAGVLDNTKNWISRSDYEESGFQKIQAKICNALGK